jgi:hypothetical protein
MCDRLKLNLGSFCHFDEERLAFEGPWRCDRRPNPGPFSARVASATGSEMMSQSS